jgi:hypothetical protein
MRLRNQKFGWQQWGTQRTQFSITNHARTYELLFGGITNNRWIYEEAFNVVQIKFVLDCPIE